MTVEFDSDKPDVAVEEIYLLIKAAAKIGHFRQEHVEAIAEQVTELSNRMKEGLYSGKQES